MSDLVEAVPWDTDFFGIPIGRVDLDGADPKRLLAIDGEAREKGMACLYGTLDPTDSVANRHVQTYGHRLVEVAFTFDRPGIPFTPTPSTSRVRPGTIDDLPALAPAVRTLAQWSRFSADPRFGTDAAYRMHRAWIERAAVETPERALYVCEDESGIIGVATFVRSPVPRPDLISVTKPGAGAGEALMAALLDWSGGVPSQAGPCAARNRVALRFYERCGFRVCEVRYLFHCWLDEAGPPA